MKTQIAILLLMTSMIFVFGCQKASQTKKPFSKLNTQEQKTIIQKISNDADWELITKSNVDFMNKLVSSNIDIQKINLTDLDGLLAATGIERSEYLNTISKVKAAANRLSQKYNIDNSNVGDISCESCKQTAEEKMTTLKSIVLNFKTNKNAFQNYNQLLTKKITSSAIGRSAVELGEV